MPKLHSVKLNRDLCVGCTNCIKKCPTEAIRVRNGKAQISESRCLDCGECIRACPHHAKSASMDPFSRLQDYPYAIALAAPSLYAQFGTPATRVMVLAALRNIGFQDVYEVAIGAEIITRKTAIYLEEARRNKIRPLISSACPAVVRLIQMKYPGLIDNLVPFDSPMEVTARLARQETMAKTGLKAEEIGIFFISPCPAKRSAVVNPIGRSGSDVNGVIAISDAYPQILAKLEKLDPAALKDFEERVLAGSAGIRWAYAGGEAIALNTSRYLAVDGIHNVIAILEEIENERLRDIDFIEANSCTGGCIGGPLTVANRFSAKSRQRGYIAAAGPSAAISTVSTAPKTLPVEPWPEPLLPNNALKLDQNIMVALQKYEQMKKIAVNLPGLDCGACGAPDCEALAEDIVRGEATETDCIFKLKERIRSVAAQMSELEEEMTRHVKKGETEGEQDNHDHGT
ncbi:MAG: [Fe-Fe] hydrogenase large subunit C-terminal domain-containing protein [Clostridiaceae bacterium]|nr:[Fe-Fe] hydrogenase large subunit C-terminal domain-containing protein [Clostridiaceae bacterium]